jgi:hypothetical protein
MRRTSLIFLGAVAVAGCTDDSAEIRELRSEVSQIRAAIETTPPTTVAISETTANTELLQAFWASVHPDAQMNWCNRYSDGETNYLYEMTREADPALWNNLSYREFREFFDPVCG